jgi:hypothetical protein
MTVARSLERRLERLIESMAGRMFSGRLHPAEMAGKLAREADFARFNHPTGPATANVYVILVNPRDLTMDSAELERLLEAEMYEYTAEEGLRLEGPVTIRITPSDETRPGRSTCHVEVAPGAPTVWARLVGSETYEIGRNRVAIGRSEEGDVVIPHDDISRRHAILYREKGQKWLWDIGSANGTWVDGVPVRTEPRLVQQGATITLGGHKYRFLESDA